MSDKEPRSAALAGQPEAPKELDCVFMIAGNRYSVRDDGTTYALEPEAPKGQEVGAPLLPAWCMTMAKLDIDLAAANAKIADMTAGAESLIREDERLRAKIAEQQERLTKAGISYDAANARIEELEQNREDNRIKDHALITQLERQRDAANARADAAERDLKRLVAVNDSGTTEVLLKAWAERDQLAARVKELTQERDHNGEMWGKAAARVEAQDEAIRALVLNSGTCTPEERAVLKACKAVPEDRLLDWRVNDTGVRRNIARAELANRAAKAKRGAK
jgi:hypothetical protein